LNRSAGLSLQLNKALTGSAVPLGAARALLGAVVLARPPLLATCLGVDSVTAQRTAWLARLFAGRDLALGAGAAGGSRGCQLAACASDVSDLLAVVLALRAKQVKPVPGVLAAAVAAGAAAAGGATLLTTKE
jgi:hypothetical protein